MVSGEFTNIPAIRGGNALKTKVMVFPGAHNLPLWLMRDIEMVYTRSRDEQIAAIQEGQIDVVHTAPDNLFLPDADGLVPFLSGTVGPLDLVTRGDDDPCVLGVDNPHSGFGRLAYRWLKEHRPTLNYDVLSVGGTLARFTALNEKRVTMAVMHPPFTQYCEQQGYEILGRIDVGFPTLVGVCRSSWMENPAMQDYRFRYREAVDRLAGSEGKDLTLEILRRQLGGSAETFEWVAEVMRREIVEVGVDLDVQSFLSLKALSVHDLGGV